MSEGQKLKNVMYEAAEKAQEILMEHYGNLETIQNKSDVDLVTIADKKSEQAIIETIAKSFPDHAILGEESGEVNAPSDAEFRWVIDPLDGTTNYAHSNPNFSISIGLQQNERTILGLVVDPTREEWFFAEHGAGAWLNDRPIAVSDNQSLAESLLITGFPHERKKNIDHILKIVSGFLMRTHGVLRLGSAALDLCWVACGRVEGFWEERLHAWDVAAGALVVEEAKGRCTNLRNDPSDIFDREIVASNGRVHEEMLQTIRDFWTEW